ncbi:MAG: transcriptional regulator with XRE-family HTH domain [Oleiphilaceae bacterium]
MNELVSVFGKMLRAKRKEAGFSQESFAAYVGIERSNYGKMERGLVNIRLDTLYKIVNALDCEFVEIMPNREDYKVTLE